MGWGARKGTTGLNVRKCRFKRIQLHRLENVGLKTVLDSSQPDVPEGLEITRFGCLPKRLQKRTVWWSLWQRFCVLWGAVRIGSNVWKCRFKHIQFHRLENVGLKAVLGFIGIFFVICGVRCAKRCHGIKCTEMTV